MSAHLFIKSLLDTIWNAGHTPKIIVDATHKDVILPEHVRQKWGDHLPLDLDANYPLNISFDEVGIHMDLAFNHTVTRCTVPWRRLYMVVDRNTGKGAVIDAHRPGKPSIVVDATAEEPPKSSPNTGWSPRVIKGGKKN